MRPGASRSFWMVGAFGRMAAAGEGLLFGGTSLFASTSMRLYSAQLPCLLKYTSECKVRRTLLHEISLSSSPIAHSLEITVPDRDWRVHHEHRHKTERKPPKRQSTKTWISNMTLSAARQEYRAGKTSNSPCTTVRYVQYCTRPPARSDLFV